MLETIIKKIMKAYGWQKLLKLCWNAIQDDLKKAALKTETKFDDNIIDIADGIIDVIVSDEKAA